MRRSRTFLGGRINFDRQFLETECLVRNLSQDGARLSFTSAPSLPVSFELKIAGRDDAKHATIIWQTDVEAGVLFGAAEGSNVVSIKARTEAAEKAILMERIARIVAKAGE